MTDYTEGYRVTGEHIRPHLDTLLAQHQELNGLSPDTLFCNGINPYSGIVIDSQSLLSAAADAIVHRAPPEHQPAQPATSGVFTRAYSFNDADRVPASFTTVDFWYLVQQAYDAA